MVFYSTKQQKMIFRENDFPFYQTTENVGGKLFSLGNHFPWKMIFPPTKHQIGMFRVRLVGEKSFFRKIVFRGKCFPMKNDFSLTFSAVLW